MSTPNRGGRPPLSEAGSVRVTVQLPRELHDWLARMARELGVPLSEAVRRCLPDVTPPRYRTLHEPKEPK